MTSKHICQIALDAEAVAYLKAKAPMLEGTAKRRARILERFPKHLALSEAVQKYLDKATLPDRDPCHDVWLFHDIQDKLEELRKP